MRSKRLALYTFGQFRELAEHPVNDGFHQRNETNLLAVDVSAGLIARSGYEGEPGPESWGLQVFPRFFIDQGDGWAPSTLSLWENLESPMAFSYTGIHAEALKHGREWFHKPAWPPYVLWWVLPGHTPDWAEAIARHEFLHDHGSTAHAFNFKAPFDELGQRTQIDMEAVKRLSRLNEERQKSLT